jgi:transcriptional regulator with XRE-family HTH domain
LTRDIHYCIIPIERDPGGELMNIGTKVRVKREEKGYTQSELAKRTGLTQATISRLESGEVRQLKSEAVKSLARALGVSVDFLVGDRRNMGFAETITSDENAQVIFRGFEKLSEEKRQQLKDYVEFLLKRHKSGGK